MADAVLEAFAAYMEDQEDKRIALFARYVRVALATFHLGWAAMASEI